MANKESCKTCRHCVFGQAAHFRWCSLRKIKVHPDLDMLVFCHHWTKRGPSLPGVEGDQQYPSTEKQLDFGKVLVSSDS